MADRVGEQFGKYRLERLLGHGGFADVYLGEHIYLKSQAAIKILHARVDADDTAGFLNEARIVASLQHPHIVRVLDFDVTAEGLPFFVMEYASNGSLRRRYTRGTRLPLDMIVSYTKQVAAALQYAHNQKLIHCDVKPENMLLSKTDQLLLSDFGVAVIAHTSRSHNMQEVAGTAAYMAPEQFQGKASSASDQYALAIVVYEWLAGSYPFRGNLTEIAVQHMMRPPRPLREVVPTLPAEVEQVVLMALAKDPKQRFARVEAFANALEQASHTSNIVSSNSTMFIVPEQITAATEPITTQSDLMEREQIVLLAEGSEGELDHTEKSAEDEDEEKKKRQPFVSRRGLLVSMAGVVTLATGGTLFALAEKTNILSYLNLRSTTGPVSSPTSSTTHTIRTYVNYSGPSSMYTVAWSPNGSWIASGGQGSSIEIWYALSGTKLLAPLDTGSSIVYSVAWSPDNRLIVSGQKNGTIQIWDTARGINVASWQGHSGLVNSVAWSPNGNYIASGGGDHKAKVWDTGGNLIYTYTGHTNYVDSVAWSSNSSTIVSGSGDATAQVWTATTGTWINTYRGHSAEIVSVAWMPKGGTRIASASVDKTVQVWEVSNGTTYVNYTKHASTVNTVAWSPDASRIASGGLDDRVRVWGAASGNTLLIYAEHTDQIQSVAWSLDSTKVASASDDGTVKVWQAT